MPSRLARVLVLVLVASTPSQILAQMIEPDRVRATSDRQDVMIPMRDGVRLFTTIYTPKDTSGGPLPMLVTRTPYGTDTYLNSIGPSVKFEQERLIFVFE